VPGYLLHENATVHCAHLPPGFATPNQTDRRVKVSGSYIVTKLMPYTVTGCSHPPPSAGNGPCATATWRTAAGRVRASGQPVLLTDSQALCAPTMTGLKVMATQTRVKGT
jgi:hypothetical protein